MRLLAMDELVSIGVEAVSCGVKIEQSIEISQLRVKPFDEVCLTDFTASIEKICEHLLNNE